MDASKLSAETDAYGAFALDSVPDGRQPLLVRAPGYALESRTVELTCARPNELEIALSAEARLVGTVTDAAGQPVPDADVRALAERPFETCAATSGADGGFALAGFALGRVHVVASHPRVGRAEAWLTAEAGATLRWDPLLAPAEGIRGAVVDGAGRPRVGWQVELTRGDDRELHITDSGGRFAFEGLAGTRYALTVQPTPGASNEFPWLVLEEVAPSLESRRLTVIDPAPDRGSLAGRVVDHDGAPLRTVLIEVGAADGVWRSFTPDATGDFEIECVPPGECQVGFASADYPLASLPEVSVSAGELTELGTVRLSVPAFARVTVVGLPPEHGRVTLAATRIDTEQEEEPAVFELTEGAYSSPPLTPGRYELRLDGDGLESHRVPIEVTPGSPLELALEARPAGRRRVALTLPATCERPGWMWCEVTDAAGAWLWDGGGRPELMDEVWRLELLVSAREGLQRFAAGTSTRLSRSGEIEIHGRGGEQAPCAVAFECE